MRRVGLGLGLELGLELGLRLGLGLGLGLGPRPLLPAHSPALPFSTYCPLLPLTAPFPYIPLLPPCRRLLKQHRETEHIKTFSKCNFQQIADYLSEMAEIKRSCSADMKKLEKASYLPPSHPRSLPSPTLVVSSVAAPPAASLPLRRGLEGSSRAGLPTYALLTHLLTATKVELDLSHLQAEKERLEERYAFAEVDGCREKLSNFCVEPPGLVLDGRSDRLGCLKARIPRGHGHTHAHRTYMACACAYHAHTVHVPTATPCTRHTRAVPMHTHMP